jgi:STE24 endopeptidase
MNPYAIVVLAALLVQWGLEVTANLLNLRALAPELPEEFRDVYDADTYRRSQEYTRARTRFQLLPSTLDLAALLAFWFLGGFPWLEARVGGLGLSGIPAGLAFIGALLVARMLLHLPFRWYGTFAIEERFGFNRTTRRTFVLDALKSVLLGALLGGLLLAGILWFFGSAGTLAWLWAWIATTVFVLVVQFVAPTWIFPLFNEYEPLKEGELKHAILEYATRVGFPLRDMFVVDGSRRSTKANAFFTGFGRNKRVALFVKGLAITVAHTGVLFFLLSFFLGEGELYAAFGMQERSLHAGLVFFGLLYTPIELVLGLGLQGLSRKHEFEADRYAAETTGAPQTMADALKRLSVDSLSNLTPHPFYVALNYSHPPVLERIAALRSG